MKKTQTSKKMSPQGESTSDIAWRVLEGVGLLMVAFMAPNAVQLFGRGRTRYRIPRRKMRRTIRRLEQCGYIRRNASDRTKWEYAITKRGKKQLRKRAIERLRIPSQKWDGMWRIVIFDIPESHALARHGLRHRLRALGFRYLNLSVWVSPYPCRDEVRALAEYFGVGEYVRYLEAAYFDGDKEFRKKFFSDL